MYNKHGLSRDIDEPTKMVVRKRDGFGCVRCGIGLYEYHHFNPPFSEAKVHNADGITLLCPTCHSATSKGILSMETIQENVNQPYCRRQGYSSYRWDLQFPMLVHFGNFIYYASSDKADHVILVVDNEYILRCCADPAGGPMQLSATFRDKNNQVCLEIVNNEWKASTDNWDVKQVGRKLIIYEEKRQIGIELESAPPHDFIFTSLTTYFNGNKLFIDKERASIHRPDGSHFALFTDGPVRRSAPIYVRPRPAVNNELKVPGRVPLPQDPVIILY